MTAAGSDQRELMARALRELQRAQQRIEELERRSQRPVAIVGAACRLPGGIDDPEALWRFLRAGGDAARPIPADRWDVDAFHDPEPGRAGRIAAARGAFLDRIDEFDAAFFGIAPREAELMDPQQRLLLECAWHAFEDAGVAVDRLRDVPVGVFVGISTVDYAYHLVANVPTDAVTGHCGTGTAHSVAAGRIAYCLDLCGPCVALDTACSSSLVALHLACQSLRQGECDYALVAGVNAMLSPLTAAAFSHARMLAPDGRCKTFAATADGYGRGEGVVALLLVRSDDCARRGVTARCEILGSAVNQDGRSAGLTVPSGRAQTAVIRRALQQAGVEPAAIDYVEAHGTGTVLGDPIELQALGAVFAGRSSNRPLLVGSSKTNLGHTEAAAGLLSVLKVMLQLEHGEIAPHLHLDARNPHVPWAELPLRVPTQVEPWPDSARRCAGVSSFGFSGTNAHAVLAAVAPPVAAADAAAPAVGGHALPLSAADPAAFAALVAAYRDALADADLATATALAARARTGRAALRHRGIVLFCTVDELRRDLQQLEPGRVLGADRVPALAATAQRFVAGERVQFEAAAIPPSGVRAPLYPFQRERHWCTTELQPQLLEEHRVAVPLPTGAAMPTRLLVAGNVPPAIAAVLAARGTELVTEGHADDWLFGVAAVDAAAGAEAIATAVRDGLSWLRRAASAARVPRIRAIVAAGDESSPVTSALRAAWRCAAVEVPALQPRWVAADLAAPPAAVVEALFASNSDDELELARGGITATRFVDRPNAAADVASPQSWSPDETVLVTGGTGALGTVLSCWLLERGVRDLWLASRHAGAVPGNVAAAAARVGAAVHAVPIDVGDAAAVDGLVATITAAGRRLASVFHLAGVAHDARLQALDDVAQTAQLRGKLAGALHLDAATAALPLRHFVLFSSAAAWLGNAGQVGYAAANGGLEGVAARRRSRGRPAVAIAFGPWRDLGLAASPAAQQRFLANGVQPLASAAALAALQAVLDMRSNSGIAVVNIEWSKLRGRRDAVPSRFQALLPPASRHESSAGADAALQQLATTDPLAAVIGALAGVLGRAPGAIAADVPLLSLGLDSLLAVELQQRLERAFGRTLGLADVLAADDCRALAARIVAAPRRGDATDATPSAVAAAASGSGLAEFVDSLTDEQVRELLARNDDQLPRREP